MSDITLPVLSRAGPPELTWELWSNTQAFVSPLSRSMQTVENPGARWRCAFGYKNLGEADASILQAALAQLRGQANRLLVPNYARLNPRGTIAGQSPTVNGAGQTGNTLVLANCGAAKTFLRGDYFKVNGEFKMVTVDSTSDGAGALTVTFEPPLRVSPANAAPVTLASPTCRMVIEQDKAGWLTRAPLFTDVNLSLIESFT